jgi:hypothetical protein
LLGFVINPVALKLNVMACASQPGPGIRYT